MMPPFLFPVARWFRRGDPGYSEQIDQLNGELKNAIEQMNTAQKFLFDNAGLIVPLGIILIIFLCFTYFQQWISQIRAVGVCGPKAPRCVWCRSKIHFWQQKKYQWGIWPIRRKPVHTQCYTEWDEAGRPHMDLAKHVRSERKGADGKGKKGKKDKKGKKGKKSKKSKKDHDDDIGGSTLDDDLEKGTRRRDEPPAYNPRLSGDTIVAG